MPEANAPGQRLFILCRVQIIRSEPVRVADQGILEQVLYNLIDNAIRYSSGGDDIAVAVEIRDTEAG